MKNRTYHLSYGMVNLPSGRMKSREGTVVDADDLIAETTSLALEETKTRYVCLSVHENVHTRATCVHEVLHCM